MRITPATYVPVLRYKGAKQTALQRLSPQVRKTTVPLIELVPKDFFEQAAQGALVKVAKGLIDACGWSHPFIVDPNTQLTPFASKAFKINSKKEVCGIQQCHNPQNVTIIRPMFFNEKTKGNN